MLIEKTEILSMVKLQNFRTSFYIGFLLITALMVFIYIYSITNDISVRLFLSDPANYTQSPFYLGVISNAGIILWAITFSILSLTYIFIKQCGWLKEERKFLFFAAAFTAVLLFDDFLLFHEVVFPDYLGISQKAVYAFYFIPLLCYLLFFLKLHLKWNFLYLLAGLFLFSTSVFFDNIPRETQLTILLEDGAKFTGIFCWLYYHLDISDRLIKNNLIFKSK